MLFRGALERIYALDYGCYRRGMLPRAIYNQRKRKGTSVVCAVPYGKRSYHGNRALCRQYSQFDSGMERLGLFCAAVSFYGTDLSCIFSNLVFSMYAGDQALPCALPAVV